MYYDGLRTPWIVFQDNFCGLGCLDGAAEIIQVTAEATAVWFFFFFFLSLLWEYSCWMMSLGGFLSLVSCCIFGAGRRAALAVFFLVFGVSGSVSPGLDYHHTGPDVLSCFFSALIVRLV